MTRGEKRYHYNKALAKKTCKHLVKLLNEYNEETNSNIELHEFYVNVLNYTENDFINLIKFINRKKNQKKKSKDKNTLRKNNVELSIRKSIKFGIGDVENPEYDKYFNIFRDYGTYLSNPNIIEDKTLTNYLIYTFNYSKEEALFEARKIQNILFTKKRTNINNKLIVKELDNQEYRIVGIV